MSLNINASLKIVFLSLALQACNSETKSAANENLDEVVTYDVQRTMSEKARTNKLISEGNTDLLLESEKKPIISDAEKEQIKQVEEEISKNPKKIIKNFSFLLNSYIKQDNNASDELIGLIKEMPIQLQGEHLALYLEAYRLSNKQEFPIEAYDIAISIASVINTREDENFDYLLEIFNSRIFKNDEVLLKEQELAKIYLAKSIKKLITLVDSDRLENEFNRWNEVIDSIRKNSLAAEQLISSEFHYPLLTHFEDNKLNINSKNIDYIFRDIELDSLPLNVVFNILSMEIDSDSYVTNNLLLRLVNMIGLRSFEEEKPIIEEYLSKNENRFANVGYMKSYYTHKSQ